MVAFNTEFAKEANVTPPICMLTLDVFADIAVLATSRKLERWMLSKTNVVVVKAGSGCEPAIRDVDNRSVPAIGLTKGANRYVPSKQKVPNSDADKDWMF